MEQAVDTMTTICPDDTAFLRFGVLFYYVPIISEKCSGLDKLDSFVQTLSSSFNYTHRIRVCLGLISNVVCLIKISVETTMVKCNIDVENITINEDSFIWNAVTDDFVRGRAYGFGEVAVVEWGRI